MTLFFFTSMGVRGRGRPLLDIFYPSSRTASIRHTGWIAQHIHYHPTAAHRPVDAAPRPWWLVPTPCRAPYPPLRPIRMRRVARHRAFDGTPCLPS
jgi:hypothetical protein